MNPSVPASIDVVRAQLNAARDCALQIVNHAHYEASRMDDAISSRRLREMADTLSEYCSQAKRALHSEHVRYLDLCDLTIEIENHMDNLAVSACCSTKLAGYMYSRP